MSYEEEDTCVCESYEEEDTCVSYEEARRGGMRVCMCHMKRRIHVSYEEEDTCASYEEARRERMRVCVCVI